jgi:hypothetical protein
MYEKAFTLIAGLGQPARGCSIDEVCIFPIFFGFFDIGIGRTVNDYIRGVIFNKILYSAFKAYVKIVSAQGKNVKLWPFGGDSNEFVTQLPARAGQ